MFIVFEPVNEHLLRLTWKEEGKRQRPEGFKLSDR